MFFTDRKLFKQQKTIVQFDISGNRFTINPILMDTKPGVCSYRKT